MDHGRESALYLKELGNKAFQKGEWMKAIQVYAEGVAEVDAMIIKPADDIKCSCLTNMAAALLKLEK
jgi:hypothetical protein